ETSLLIDQLTADGIAAALNKLLNNRVLYRYLQEQCALAALDWCWENESKRLVAFWAQILPL
ncbi:MAG TPA: group 1 glycosyl transferase, partial [Phnomibacter sp.]|nr:group 1 glycosyl transferase [Phnomibacter sp.]